MLDTVRQKFHDSPYWRLLGMRIEDAEPGFARLALPCKNELLQGYGQMHGGAVASLIDSAVAVALSLTLLPTEKATTVELKVNYLEPILAGEVYAHSKIRKRGKTIIVGTTEVFDEAGRLLVIGTATYMILKR